jgi:hypothetical protein
MHWLRLALATLIGVGAAPLAGATSLAPLHASAPPPALEERVPPLPGPGAFTWLPGRWAWTGIAGVEWQWQPGRFVAWPPAQTTAIDLSEPPSSGWAVSGPTGD